ncbi:MAG TPA: endonuclease/exonuclease/phosphatase family protein [Thermoanaerobaculia bacterium]|nr:endonuclease/exonuclease/phosphatase family protein [Thermoanaerobaculia bacterium]
MLTTRWPSRRSWSHAVLAAALALSISSPSLAQVSAGDTVTLRERDLDIPAHPAPGDNQVTFRFEGGTEASVLAIDPATTWLEIQGTDTGGSSRTGWITLSYVASIAPSNGGGAGGPGMIVSDPLAWCPPKGSLGPHPSGRLRLATWNLGNLHAQDGGTVFGPPRPSVAREAIDYDRIRCYVRLFDPDVLAVQEVHGEAALRRVVDTDVYDLHVTTGGGLQNTGFAYKKGLTVTEQNAVTDLDVSGGLRHGARIDLTHNGQTLRLLGVHLKSGCFSNSSSGGACTTLSAQVPELEAWIDEAAAGPDAFVVLGDFNRRFNEPEDMVWTNLDDADPPNAELLAATEDMPISCRTNEFTEFIDHVVLDRRATEWFERSSFRHVTFRQADREEWDRISDHCPVVVDLWIE